LPTYAARGFFFSGLLELARLPAMADLARAAMSAFFGGDASQWERALVMPHYSAAGMPACSLHQVCLVREGEGLHGWLISFMFAWWSNWHLSHMCVAFQDMV
jgi:hypothetical protein